MTRLVSKYSPAALAKALAEEGITILNGVPATYQRLLEYKQMAGLPKLERGALRLMSVAGAPLDLELKARVEKELGLPLVERVRHHRMLARDFRRSAGCAAQRQFGRHAAAGHRGRSRRTSTAPRWRTARSASCMSAGRNVMRGYYRAPDLTAKAIDPDGWFNTGDLARFEGDACSSSAAPRK